MTLSIHLWPRFGGDWIYLNLEILADKYHALRTRITGGTVEDHQNLNWLDCLIDEVGNLSRNNGTSP